LAAALAVEGRGPRNELALAAGLEALDPLAVGDERDDARARLLLLVAEELGRRQLFGELVVDGVDRCAAGRRIRRAGELVRRPRLFVAGRVDREALLATDDLLEIEREAVRAEEVVGDRAGKELLAVLLDPLA